MIRIVFMEPNHITPSSASTPSSLNDDFNDRNYRDASAGAGKLLGLPRDEIIGCLIEPGVRLEYYTTITDRK